jgi:hypothetical protein
MQETFVGLGVKARGRKTSQRSSRSRRGDFEKKKEKLLGEHKKTLALT